MKANEVLKAALVHMEDRAATYDKPEGERSMPATVSAFNALTGHQLTAEQGWLFMTVLKLCRTQQGGFRADNYEDGAAYFALMGEQAAGDRQFGEKLISACEQVNEQMAQEIHPVAKEAAHKLIQALAGTVAGTDPYGPRDAEGWYGWKGDETMRPAGNVDATRRDGIVLSTGAENLNWAHLESRAMFDIVKWRPAQ